MLLFLVEVGKHRAKTDRLWLGHSSSPGVAVRFLEWCSVECEDEMKVCLDHADSPLCKAFTKAAAPPALLLAEELKAICCRRPSTSP